MSEPANTDRQAEWCRHRLLQLNSPCDETLLQQLRDTDGVLELQQDQGNTLRFGYDLRRTSLHHLEKIIRANGQEFTASFWHSFKRAIFRYTEHIQIKNSILDTGWDVWVRDVYLSDYRNRQHGRRDLRVQQWRKYVKD